MQTRSVLRLIKPERLTKLVIKDRTRAWLALIRFSRRWIQKTPQMITFSKSVSVLQRMWCRRLRNNVTRLPNSVITIWSMLVTRPIHSVIESHFKKCRDTLSLELCNSVGASFKTTKCKFRRLRSIRLSCFSDSSSKSKIDSWGIVVWWWVTMLRRLPITKTSITLRCTWARSKIPTFPWLRPQH